MNATLNSLRHMDIEKRRVRLAMMLSDAGTVRHLARQMNCASQTLYDLGIKGVRTKRWSKQEKEGVLAEVDALVVKGKTQAEALTIVAIGPGAYRKWRRQAKEAKLANRPKPKRRPLTTYEIECRLFEGNMQGTLAAYYREQGL